VAAFLFWERQRLAGCGGVGDPALHLRDLALQAGKDALKEKAAGELKGKAGGLLDGLLRSKK
jgi:hypothetical protein